MFFYSLGGQPTHRKGACVFISSSSTPLIATFPTYESVPEVQLKESLVIVIDVLRATSTIVTALASGAREVLPVEEVDEAMALYRRVGAEQALLCGERGALPIEGFHLSNSPLEYTPEQVAGKSIILTTTNGTRALHRARTARFALVGSLLNASAVARVAAQWDRNIILLCAGTHGRFSTDDVLCAGAIADALLHLNPLLRSELDDLSRLAVDLFERHRENPAGALTDTQHYRRMMSLHLSDDIRYCMQKNVLHVVPQVTQGTVRLLSLDSGSPLFV